MTQEFHTWSLNTTVLIKWLMPGSLVSSQMGHPTFKIAPRVRSSKVAGAELCTGGGRLPVAPLPILVATTQEALMGEGRKEEPEVHFALSRTSCRPAAAPSREMLPTVT